MVNLTRIYTRTGDQGQTRLVDNALVAKSDRRLEAYGTVDEANSAIGVALALPQVPERVAVVLGSIQNELFDLGADLATPYTEQAKNRAIRVETPWVTQLETWCDEFAAGLEDLKSFLLPGGAPLAASLNLARTIVRRAERAAWAAAEVVEINPIAIAYLNRLSDLLFILGRYANRQAGIAEVLWTPAPTR
ncbi:MAG: cob(I)yrinic acid a,c-diamide adenosyltransferase [Propionibacteriaceae bacterium]|jgi:cob(I)alamin adenosyltransferase|nr:cob(I)yrinic acid a,c-diamide adenosyltransferase [Propionibacteriaceae bacterium]